MAKKRRAGAHRAPSRTAKKAKNVVGVILVIILTLALVAGVLALVFLLKPSENPAPSVQPSQTSEPTAYSITYRAVVDGVETDVPAFLYEQGGNYPTAYQTGAGVQISDLNGRARVIETSFGQSITGAHVEESSKIGYAFWGWYWDKDCTQALSGGAFTSAEARGDKTFYAKIETLATYSITYRAIVNGTETDVYAPLYEQGGNYPTNYTAGEAFPISDLKGRVYANVWTEYSEDNVSYAFHGWYLDRACTQEVTGFSMKTRGDKTLYAKISQSLWIGPY